MGVWQTQDLWCSGGRLVNMGLRLLDRCDKFSARESGNAGTRRNDTPRMQLCMVWISGLRLLVAIIYLFDSVL